MHIDEIPGQNRVIITQVSGVIEETLFAIKRVVGDDVVVEADIFCDGHTRIAANLMYKKEGSSTWHETTMSHLVNDRWQGSFFVSEIGTYEYTISAWTDHFATWQRDFQKKFDAHVNTQTDLLVGLSLIEQALTQDENSELRQKYEALKRAKDQSLLYLSQDPELHNLIRQTETNKQWVTTFRHILRVSVEPKRALFSSWYELFPRSCSSIPNKHATFDDVLLWLDEIAFMGFDVLYLPPIHPIGRSHRKGANNSLIANDDDPGCPWAIGGFEGGHTSILDALGSIDDFVHLVQKAKEAW